MKLKRKEKPALFLISRTCDRRYSEYCKTNPTYQLGHSISNNIECAPKEDSDQPAHGRSLIRVFTVRCPDSQGPKASSYQQLRL